MEEAEIAFEDLVDPYGIAFYPEFKGRDGCRTPMPWNDVATHAGFCPEDVSPWLPIPEHHKQRAVNRAIENPQSLLHAVRDLLGFRKNHPALALGSMRIIESDASLLVFERTLESQKATCVFNLSSRQIDVRVPPGWDPAKVQQRGVVPSTEPGHLSMTAWSWYIHAS